MASLLWGYARLPMMLASGLGVVLSGALYMFQNELIYPRNMPPGARSDVPRPARMGLPDSEELLLPTVDGETLSAFLIRPDNKSHARNVTIIMFHGNAGNIGHRLPIARVLANDLNCNVFMLQYRGYGLSTGTPNEKGIAIDAQTGLDYVRRRDDMKNSRIVLYGQSLGGAVAIGLAARNQQDGDIAGMILENTFLSIHKMIPSAMPIAKFLTPLCHELWPSEAVIPTIKNIPILFMSGLRDEIVPPSHMKRLYELYRTGPKVWKELPYGDHNNTVSESGYFYFVDDYLRDYVVSSQDQDVGKG